MCCPASGTGPTGPDKEKGAVAVEFALVLPIFLVLVLGIFEFGRGFNIQVSLSEAARESARYAAVHARDAGFSVGAAQNVGVAAAPSVALTAREYRNFVPESTAQRHQCAHTGVNVVSTVILLDRLPDGAREANRSQQAFTLTGRGVMRCGG